MNKVTNITLYRCKKQIGHNPDSFRIASAILAVDDLNREIERKYQSQLAMNKMFDNPIENFPTLEKK